MAELTDLRARLRDRQKKAGALGTTDTTLCLDLDLIQELEELKAERDTIVDAAPEPSGKSRLGSTQAPNVDTADVDARIAAKEDEIRAASIRVVFRALASSKYQEVVNNHPEANEDGAAYADFLNNLAGECLYEVWEDGKKVSNVEWDDIREGTSYGEWDIATTKVLALNRRTVDIPFSLKPSKSPRQR